MLFIDWEVQIEKHFAWVAGQGLCIEAPEANQTEGYKN